MTAVFRWSRLRVVLVCCCVLAGCRTAPKRTVAEVTSIPPEETNPVQVFAPKSATQTEPRSLVSPQLPKGGGAALEKNPGGPTRLPDTRGPSATTNQASAPMPLTDPRSAGKPAPRDPSAPLPLPMAAAKPPRATAHETSLPFPLEDGEKTQPAGVLSTLPPHLPVWVAGSTNGESPSGSIPLWNGTPGSGQATGSPATPLQIDVGPGASSPSIGTNDPSPIRIERWADQAAGAKWREQQLAKQAAERKAREEAREKLRRALYKFLLQEEIPGM